MNKPTVPRQVEGTKTEEKKEKEIHKLKQRDIPSTLPKKRYVQS